MNWHNILRFSKERTNWVDVLRMNSMSFKKRILIFLYLFEWPNKKKISWIRIDVRLLKWPSETATYLVEEGKLSQIKAHLTYPTFNLHSIYLVSQIHRWIIPDIVFIMFVVFIIFHLLLLTEMTWYIFQEIFRESRKW